MLAGKALNNIVLHVPNDVLKDVYMHNYGAINNMNSLFYTHFFSSSSFFLII